MGELFVMTADWKEKLDKLKELIDFIKDAADKRQSAEDSQALESIDETVREMMQKLFGDSVTVDALDGYVTEHAQEFKEHTPIFSREYRQRIIKGFRSYGYKDVSAETMERYFDLLDGLLHANLTKDSVILLRHIVPILPKLDEMDANINEIRRLVIEILQKLYPDKNKALYQYNKLYDEEFTRPLFLHSYGADKNDNVNLLRLFVPHKFEILSENDEPEQPSESMDDYLARFIHDDGRRKAKVLFIEGDAGCGKSSLCAYLNYYFINNIDFRRDIFGDCPFITVRLREIDIPAKGADANRLIDGILNALQIDRNQLRDLNPVLFLDGYDELCAVENLRDTQKALDGLWTLNCKTIVTTRPKYIQTNQFDRSRHPYEHIRLRHFDKSQREQWLNNYTNIDGVTLDELNREYLAHIDTENDAAGICDTPMGLYMVAAGHFQPGDLKNEWALYNRIFQTEQVERHYGGHKIHNSGNYWENFYRVSEEISYYLFQHNNANLLVPDSIVNGIVEDLKLGDAEKIVKQSFALCGYWKTHTDKGCVEFYHNNIRDFFLCEKIMRELNDAYQQHETILRDKKADITPFLKRLCNLFERGKNVEERVLEFICLRVTYKKENGGLDDCARMERDGRFLPRIFETLLTDSTTYPIIRKENPVKTIGRVLTNVFRVYSSLYLSILEENEYIQWWTNVNKINTDGTLRQLSDRVLQYAPRANLSGVNLTGVDLRRADLSCTNLRNVIFNGSNLIRVNFSHSDLTDADLTNTKLQGADLSGADLSGVDFEIANLSYAKVHNANFKGANLKNAKLFCCTLRSARNVPKKYLPRRR